MKQRNKENKKNKGTSETVGNKKDRKTIETSRIMGEEGQWYKWDGETKVKQVGQGDKWHNETDNEIMYLYETISNGEKKTQSTKRLASVQYLLEPIRKHRE